MTDAPNKVPEFVSRSRAAQLRSAASPWGLNIADRG